ncbi:MAG: hypothetical protein J7501_09725 [Bdellovibrio sp.]|nr:hypothetical protein [Bdellovibrio sp.]
MFKYIVSTMFVMMSVQAHALIVNDGGSDTLIGCWNGLSIGGKPVSGSWNGACLMSSYTSSFPTITIEGQDLDLKSTEASDRLVAEVDGVVQPVLLNKIAKDLNLSLPQVMATAASIDDLNLGSLLAALKK